MAMTREQVIELVQKMRSHTIENGCTPGEAAKFAAKVAEMIEQYQIEEAELRAAQGDGSPEIEVCQNLLRTGKKVFNPGMTAVVNGLAIGVNCKCILLRKGDEAVYGIIGETLDANYVCQIALSVVPALRVMGMMEGTEYGHEKAALIRWTNQYLIGAGEIICQRLKEERKFRSDIREEEHKASGSCTVLITGHTLALAKQQAVKAVFDDMYPKTKQTFTRSDYDPTARARGREAGKSIGLNLTLGE